MDEEEKKEQVIPEWTRTAHRGHSMAALTMRLHTAPWRLWRSGVSLTWSRVTMAIPIRSH